MSWPLVSHVPYASSITTICRSYLKPYLTRLKSRRVPYLPRLQSAMGSIADFRSATWDLVGDFMVDWGEAACNFWEVWVEDKLQTNLKLTLHRISAQYNPRVHLKLKNSVAFSPAEASETVDTTHDPHTIDPAVGGHINSTSFRLSATSMFLNGPRALAYRPLSVIHSVPLPNPWRPGRCCSVPKKLRCPRKNFINSGYCPLHPRSQRSKARCTSSPSRARSGF